MNSNFGLLFLLIVPFSSAETTKQLEANLTCYGELSFFLNGKQFGRNDQTNITSTYSLKPGTEVLAVRCRNYRHKPWILGSVSNGLVTDTRWKCTSLQEHLKKNNLFWRNPYFDDSQWAQAIAKFSNQEANPWGKVLGIRDEALWISTADENHTRLFCRRRLSDLSLKRAKDSLMGMFQATIDDVDHALLHRPRSQHEVGDVMQCFKKCQGDSQCHSFNFEHDSVLPTRKCELNDATKGQDPVNYVRRPGYTYYENAE
ncbi:hypothetical protein OS493_005540 [Desmophyllum pertusum]|uniref:Apple domain-containing protein n=1 Tax=Desmophyllum pertusum TaxID=174260 RepID=A0A9W9YSI0_9CNID|nr:hypothetical protein OS493_005540 [Desmophyllum pertusum]